MKDEKIYRGDIYLANLNPYKGSEQGGKRPVIIIQNDVGNHYSPTVIVTAVTSRFFKKRALPTHVPLDNAELEKNSLALLEQIRTIDKSRLIRKIGRVPKEKMKEIGAAIHVSLDLGDADEQLTNTNDADGITVAAEKDSATNKLTIAKATAGVGGANGTSTVEELVINLTSANWNTVAEYYAAQRLASANQATDTFRIATVTVTITKD